jgi:hypothetical protein
VIPYSHPTFQTHLAYLIKKVCDVSGLTGYNIRTEIMGKFEEGRYDLDEVSCGSCGAHISVTKDCKEDHTGFTPFLDTIRHSPCCRSAIDPKLCPFVCVRCRRIALFLSPHVSTESKFEYVAGRYHHLDSCSECHREDGYVSKILEVAVHKHLNNIQ